MKYPPKGLIPFDILFRRPTQNKQIDTNKKAFFLKRLFVSGRHPFPSENVRCLPLWVILSSVVCAVGDYFTGPTVQFPILFLIPVTIASWYRGTPWGIVVSVLLPLIRLSFTFLWVIPWSLFETGVNTTIRILLFSIFSILVGNAARHQRELTKEVRILRGFLSICSFCKKIRTSEGTWEQMEKYISDHSEAVFSHGLCPECAHEHYGYTETDHSSEPAAAAARALTLRKRSEVGSRRSA